MPNNTDLLPNATKRLQLILTVNGNRKTTTLRILETTDDSDLTTIATEYCNALDDLYSLSGLVPASRESEVTLQEVFVAEKDSDLFIPKNLGLGSLVNTGVGVPMVRDHLSLASITGRAASGKKVIFYFSGISCDLGADSLSGNYGDMRLDAAELPALVSWLDDYWTLGAPLFDALVGPDNSPLMFVRPRLLVRFSTRMTNKLRKR